MSIKSTVTLSSNGKYWQALYYDNTGQRRAKGLGPKKELSRRKAKVMCDRLAAELQLNPVCGLPGRAFRLGDYLERYIASRTDLRPKTLELHKLTRTHFITS